MSWPKVEAHRASLQVGKGVSLSSRAGEAARSQKGRGRVVRAGGQGDSGPKRSQEATESPGSEDHAQQPKSTSQSFFVPLCPQNNVWSLVCSWEKARNLKESGCQGTGPVSIMQARLMDLSILL